MRVRAGGGERVLALGAVEALAPFLAAADAARVEDRWRELLPTGLRLLLFAEVFNLLNTANLVQYSGNLANPVNAKVEGAAQAAHQATDKIADKATAQVDRLSGTAHRAINTAADGATSATEWASSAAEQAKQVQTRLTDSASASIRARPIVTVAGALVIGYLIGRLARL